MKGWQSRLLKIAFNVATILSGHAIHPSFWLGISILNAVCAAVLGWLTLRLPKHRLRLCLIVLALGFVAASPLWVPADERVYRLAATLVAVTMLIKLLDLHAGNTGPPLREFLPYLFNVFLLVYRRRDSAPRPQFRKDLQALSRAALKTAATLPFCIWAFLASWNGLPFLIEHAAKAASMFLVIEPATAIFAALWRLSGRPAMEFMDAPMLASTPADFWRRYNRPVQQFFYENVFLPIGGRRAPIRATLVIFGISALIHEYVFGIIIGRVQGFQTAFFLIQGFAVAATLRLRPRGAMVWVARAGTLAFNLAASVLFFASVNQIVPFYSRPLPQLLAP